jgi:hypothetical protein
MTTDYKNLSRFEIAAVSMIAIGVVLVGAQVFMSLPDTAQAKITGAFQVLEMSGATQEVWEVEMAANEIVFNGMEDFYKELYVAIGEMAMPMAENISKTADNFAAVARAVTSVSDNIASNYQNNYVMSGVEAGMGGKVMGAYFERLAE